MMSRRRFAGAMAVGMMVPAVGGCPPPRRLDPLAPISMREAIGVVNTNIAKIGGTLRATGTVTGHVPLKSGRSRSYHLDAVLFFLAPRNLRFDLKKFGDRQILLGSNERSYWFYSKADREYFCSSHDEPDSLPPEMPVRPHRIIDALGLTSMMGNHGPAGSTQRVQRIVEEHQQILHLVHDNQGRLVLEQEYWLDRYWPRLVRRVIFRDADGNVEMKSELNDYHRLTAGGPWLPHEMKATWPGSDCDLHFRVRKWSLHAHLKADAIQFATPRECSERAPAG